jgi:choice-of-anchor C domain-containing protein
MKTKTGKIGVISALGVMLLPIVASANLVTDGDFTAAGTPSSFTTYSASQTMGGWNVTAGSVDLIGGYWQSPPGGGNSVDLAGNSSGTISQTISGLVVGQYYTLSFALSGNPDGPPDLKKLGVNLAIGSASFSYDTAAQGTTRPQPMHYVTESATFKATSISELLQFQDHSSYEGITPYGAVIGNVCLVAVPETSTMIAGALLLLPFGASALRIRRRNRKA